jgi:hypothetical protein
MAKTHHLVLAAFSVLVLGVVLTAGCGCAREHTISIGEFSSKSVALRAAMPKLAAEIDRCPRAEVYRIMWEGTEASEGSLNRHSLLYDRIYKRLGYEDDLESGISGKAYVVDDASIRAVAQRGGTLDDFDDLSSKSKE